jgi:hypothetical protein
VHQKVPAKGQIGIFNRSHYEDVLITRVHGWISDKEAERRLIRSGIRGAAGRARDGNCQVLPAYFEG